MLMKMSWVRKRGRGVLSSRRIKRRRWLSSMWKNGKLIICWQPWLYRDLYVMFFILCLHNQNLFVISNNPEKRCPEFADRRGLTLKGGLINKWDPYPSTNYDLKCDIYKYLNLSLCCLLYPFLFNLISYFSVNLYNDSCSILDPRSQRAGSYKFGAVIVNV